MSNGDYGNGDGNKTHDGNGTEVAVDKKGDGNSGKSDEDGNKEPPLPSRTTSIPAIDGRHGRCRTVNCEWWWWS
jgi:hypothetical protein